MEIFENSNFVDRKPSHEKFFSALVGLLFCTVFNAQALGASELIFDYEAINSNYTALNVALVTANGQLWYAVEWMDDTTDEPVLDLFWDDNTTITRKTLTSAGDLAAGNAMYPAIVTWGTHQYVYVAGKVDANPTSPQLKFFRQDRDDFSIVESTTTLGNAPVGVEHSRPHLAYDEDMGSGLGTNQMYACWTAKNAGEEDVKSKAKPSDIAWRKVHSLHEVSAQVAVTEDHCEQSFNHMGDRYTVYHKNDGGNSTWVHVDHWDFSTNTWTDHVDFELLNESNTRAITNFPSIATSIDAGNTHHLIVAKRQVAAFDLISWTCDATTAGDCESESDWTYLRQDLRGSVFAPKAVVYNDDRYVLYEDRAGAPTLRLYKMCSGDTTWTEVGEIPEPDVSHNGVREFNADINSSAVSTFTVDRNNEILHAIFVALKNTTSSYNPAHWELDISGGCASL